MGAMRSQVVESKNMEMKTAMKKATQARTLRQNHHGHRYQFCLREMTSHLHEYL